MAIAIKTVHALVTDSLADVYTPSGVPAIVAKIYVANIGSITYQITIEKEDNSAGTFRDIASAIDVPPNDTLTFGPTFLEASDSLRAVASTTSVLEITLEIIEDPLN